MCTRMSVSRVHARAGLACERARLSCIKFRAPVNQNDVSASTCGHCQGSKLRLVCARSRLSGHCQGSKLSLVCARSWLFCARSRLVCARSRLVTSCFPHTDIEYISYMCILSFVLPSAFAMADLNSCSPDDVLQLAVDVAQGISWWTSYIFTIYYNRSHLLPFIAIPLVNTVFTIVIILVMILKTKTNIENQIFISDHFPSFPFLVTQLLSPFTVTN